MMKPNKRAESARKRKKRQRKAKPTKSPLTREQTDFLDYKDLPTLEKFISQQGKILGRKRTGADAQQQRTITLAIKHARHMALLPFVAK